MDNKLQRTDVQQMPPWVRHFFLHVVKRCATILIAWIDEMKESSRETPQVETIHSNGRLIR